MAESPTSPQTTQGTSTLNRPVYIVDGSRTPQLKAKGKPVSIDLRYRHGIAVLYEKEAV